MVVVKQRCDEYGLCAELSSKCRSLRPGGLKGFVISDMSGKSVVSYMTGRVGSGVPVRFCPFCGYSFLSNISDCNNEKKS